MQGKPLRSAPDGHSWFRAFFFFNDTATTEIYTLSLHDALPISPERKSGCFKSPSSGDSASRPRFTDRKSTRLNSSHSQISYAVFCLKKKNPPRPRHIPGSRRARTGTLPQTEPRAYNSASHVYSV